MTYYTAKELADLLLEEGDEEMTLRKVRYYTQIGMLSPLEMDDKKPRYSTKHLEELRAIRVMQKTGERLEDIKGKMRGMDEQRLNALNTHSNYLYVDKLLHTTTHVVNQDIALTFSDQLDASMKNAIIQAVEQVISK